jgi:hypothetical protein
MKSFKEYLTESKKTYDFKVKVAGDCPENCIDLIKEALDKFDVASCAEAKRTPIQESHADFPDYRNVHVTVYDVCLNYPATSEQVRNFVAEKINKEQSAIRVRTPHDEKEYEINHENDEKSSKALLTADYEKSNNQDLVGEKKIASFLKELSKNKTSGEQYKGVNDKILAKKVPAEKTVKAEKASATKSPISGKGK